MILDLAFAINIYKKLFTFIYPFFSFILPYFSLKHKKKLLKTSGDLGDLRVKDLTPRTDSMI